MYFWLYLDYISILLDNSGLVLCIGWVFICYLFDFWRNKKFKFVCRMSMFYYGLSNEYVCDIVYIWGCLYGYGSSEVEDW